MMQLSASLSSPALSEHIPLDRTLGKHRDHTVCQIDTGTPFQCLSIKCTVLLHIIRHICNMHAQNIIFSLFFRVIASSRSFASSPSIVTVCQLRTSLSCHISGRHCLCHTLCLIQYLLRKFGWQIISFDYRQNINSRIGHMPQDLHDLSFRFLSILSIRGQLYHNLMPGHSSFRALCRYEDILQETLIIRHNESEILPALIIADDPLGSPLYDFRDLSFSLRFPSGALVMTTSTSSPCMAPFISSSEIKISSLSPSTVTKPKPLAFAWNIPRTLLLPHL